MIEIKTKTGTIIAESVSEVDTEVDGKKYPSLRFTFPGGITDKQLKMLTSGELELGGVVRKGYTTLAEVSATVCKITTADEKIVERETELTETQETLDKTQETLDKTRVIVLEAPDEQAATVPELFPELTEDGSLVRAGTRINWKGVLKKAAVDLWDTPENNPDNAPDLWKTLNYRDGYRIIPEVITVTEAFGKDEVGWWKDELYKSVVDVNVYTPEQYAQNWEKVE